MRITSRYYYEANKDRLDRVPDLSDSSGGLSNPVYFNFIYYILWKQIAQVTGPEQREVFGSIFGRRLADLIAPGTREQLQAKGALLLCASSASLQPHSFSTLSFTFLCFGLPQAVVLFDGEGDGGPAC